MPALSAAGGWLAAAHARLEVDLEIQFASNAGIDPPHLSPAIRQGLRAVAQRRAATSTVCLHGAERLQLLHEAALAYAESLAEIGRHRRCLLVALNAARLCAGPDDVSLPALASVLMKRVVAASKPFSPLGSRHGAALSMYLEAAFNGGASPVPPAIAREHPRVVASLRELATMLSQAGKWSADAGRGSSAGREEAVFVVAKLPFLLAPVLGANEVVLVLHEEAAPTALLALFRDFLLHAAADAGPAFASTVLASLETAEALGPLRSGAFLLDCNLLSWSPPAAHKPPPAPASESGLALPALQPALASAPRAASPLGGLVAASSPRAESSAAGAWTPLETAGSTASGPVVAGPLRSSPAMHAEAQRRLTCLRMMNACGGLRASLAGVRAAVEEAAADLVPSIRILLPLVRQPPLPTASEAPAVFDLRRTETAASGIFCRLHAEARGGRRALEAAGKSRLHVCHQTQAGKRLHVELDGVFTDETEAAAVDEALALEATLAAAAAGEGDPPCFVLCGPEGASAASPTRNALGSERRPGLLLRVLALLFQLRREALRGAIGGCPEEWDVSVGVLEVAPTSPAPPDAGAIVFTPGSTPTPKAGRPVAVRRRIELGGASPAQPTAGVVHVVCDSLQDAADLLRLSCPPGPAKAPPAAGGAAGAVRRGRHRIIEVVIEQHQADVQWRTSVFRLAFVTVDTSADVPDLRDIAHVLATPGDLAAILQRRRSAATALAAASGAPQRLADLLRDRLRPGTRLQIVGHVCDGASEDTQSTLEFLAQCRGAALSWGPPAAPSVAPGTPGGALALTLARRMKREAQEHADDCARLRAEAQAADARFRQTNLEVTRLRAVVRQLQAQLRRAARGPQHDASVQQLRRAMLQSVARANAAAAEGARLAGLAGVSVADAIAGPPPAPAAEEDGWSLADSAAAVGGGSEGDALAAVDVALEAAREEAGQLREALAALQADRDAAVAALRARDAELVQLRGRVADAEHERDEQVRVLDERVDHLIEQSRTIRLRALQQEDASSAAREREMSALQKRCAELEAALSKAASDVQVAVASERRQAGEVAKMAEAKQYAEGVAQQWSEEAARLAERAGGDGAVEELHRQIAELEAQVQAALEGAAHAPDEELLARLHYAEHTAAAVEAENARLRAELQRGAGSGAEAAGLRAALAEREQQTNEELMMASQLLQDTERRLHHVQGTSWTLACTVDILRGDTLTFLASGPQPEHKSLFCCVTRTLGRFEWAPQANYRALGHIELSEVSRIVLGTVSADTTAAVPPEERWMCFTLVPKRGAAPRPCLELQASDTMQLRIWFMGLQALVQQPASLRKSLAQVLWYIALSRFRVWRGAATASARPPTRPTSGTGWRR